MNAAHTQGCTLAVSTAVKVFFSEFHFIDSILNRNELQELLAVAGTIFNATISPTRLNHSCFFSFYHPLIPTLANLCDAVSSARFYISKAFSAKVTLSFI